MLDKIGGRKLAVSVLCLAAGVAIDLTTERGLSENLLYLMVGIIGTFTAGNVASKKVWASSNSTATSSTNYESVAEIRESIDELRDDMSEMGQALSSIGTSAANTNKLLNVALNRTQ